MVNALSLYYETISHLYKPQNDTLTPAEVDKNIDGLKYTSVNKSTNSSFIMIQSVLKNETIDVLGAFFEQNVGGKIIQNMNLDEIIRPNILAAAAVNITSLADITSFNMLIIGKPIGHKTVAHSSNKELVSSVIVASIQNDSSALHSVNISLYFKILNGYDSNSNEKYSCSFYDINSSTWNDAGCNKPIYNDTLKGCKCDCNHLTTFGLFRQLSTPACSNATHSTLTNGTCGTKAEAKVRCNILIFVVFYNLSFRQKSALDLLRNNASNSSDIANGLSVYIDAITPTNSSSKPDNTLSIKEIDEYVGKLNGTIESINKNSSFIMAQTINDSVKVLGASFTHNIGGQIVNTTNQHNVTRSNLSAAGIIGEQSLDDIVSLNMFIIDSPAAFISEDNITNKTLASSIIIASVRPTPNAIQIVLYFKVLPEYKPNISVTYLCSFYNTNTSQWNESGCSVPVYDSSLDRYECTCTHLTTFALIWLPKTSQLNYLTAQDIASLIFQSISILSFIAVIIHSLLTRFINPFMSLRPRDLLPLISSASTTILFILFIALIVTVYTRTASQSETKCFLSSTVLMFFVYFFLIFMFCIKTSIGYFNYLRFVHLFPEPSHRKLVILLMISFFIAITSTSFAAGFNSNSSYNITRLYGNKICWFSRDVIYYFMTIPVCIFLLVNLITIIFVGKHIIDHVRRSTSPHQSYERMKRCVLVLLSSCVTQGIGWLFGPFINPTDGEIVGWFFVIFVGLEGVWTILLYMIIRSQHMDEQLRVTAYTKLTKTTALSLIKHKKEYSSDLNSKLTRRFQNTHQNNRKEQSVFNDLPEVYYIDWETNSSYV